MAFWILSLGIDASRAFCTAVPSDGFPSMSPPPSRAATVIARASLEKSLPRFASAAPFLCLIDDHFECPDIQVSFYWREIVFGNGGEELRTQSGRNGGIPRHAPGRFLALDADPPGLGLHRLEAGPQPIPEHRALHGGDRRDH